MRRSGGRLLFGLVVVALAGGVWLAWPRSPGSGVPGPAAARAADNGGTGDRWVGVASCASGACHGAGEGPGAKRSEYTTWAGFDNHARAFAVLYEERSDRMCRNLYGPGARKATETELCLKCHTSNNGRTDNVGSRFGVGDGVGCESCHGAAGRWLTVHYQDDFRNQSPEYKESLGLRNTKDLTVRARVCTTCHVGNAEKEVNHDLIAAGHPRLNFEFAAFHANYPKHWPIREDLDRHPDLAARLWAEGQLVSAEAALELLQSRAASAARGGPDAKPWPEFAEYACFACHRDIKADPRALQAARAADPRRGPGVLPWGTWYLTMPEAYAGQSGERQVLESSLRRLRGLMERPGPEPSGVAREAARAARTLDDWLKRLRRGGPATAGRVRELMGAFAQDAARRADGLDWDEASQFYLALAALYEGLGDLTGQPPVQTRRDLIDIRDRLKGAFPPGFNSPRLFNPRAEPRLGEQFEDIRRQLGY